MKKLILLSFFTVITVLGVSAQNSVWFYVNNLSGDECTVSTEFFDYVTAETFKGELVVVPAYGSALMPAVSVPSSNSYNVVVRKTWFLLPNHAFLVRSTPINSSMVFTLTIADDEYGTMNLTW